MNDYIYEVKFYLICMIERECLKDETLLIDNYMEAIDKIYDNYIKYDNTNMSLMSSIERYLKEHRGFILKVLSGSEVLENEKD